VSGAILILRPEPGASASAERARALGMTAYVAPLFTLRALPWEAPDPAGYDALLLTSASAARLGGEGLRRFAGLPCYCVGEASAEAARAAGFADVRTGPGDGAAAAAMMAAGGAKRAFHPCGRDHAVLAPPGVAIERRTVYAADPVAALPEAARAALARGALALLHSPRAASLLADLVADRAGIALAAISAAAAEAAGEGWRAKAVAAAPRDEALLELAAKLCQTAAPGGCGAQG
jgi:uroporphyrinogen-III synthase